MDEEDEFSPADETIITAIDEKPAASPAAVGKKIPLTPASQQILKRFQQELSISGYSERTQEMYALYVSQFLGFMNDQKEPANMTREDIIAFMASKKEAGVNSPTLALVHASLKYFFHQHLHHKIVEEIKIPKKAKKLPTVLTKEELNALFKVLPAGRIRLMIEFLYSTGVRVSEACHMKLEDVNFVEGTGRVVGGKGNKDRLIILSKEWITDAKKYLRRRRVPSEFLFAKKNGVPISPDSPQRWLRIACKKAGVNKHVTPHSMRHSFGTHLLEKGENIRTIQELLGHASLNTTQIYTHVAQDQLKKVQSPLDNLNEKKVKKISTEDLAKAFPNLGLNTE